MSSALTSVVVSGVPGRLATAIARAAADSPQVALEGVYNPRHDGSWEGHPYVTEGDAGDADVVVETAPDAVVMDNLASWRRMGVAAVVGTSGFTSDRLEEVRQMWAGSDRACLVVPNFSLGAVLAVRFAEMAARHFATTEVIERHRAGKPDAPSGTALNAAARIAAAGGSSAGRSHELVSGALGGDVDGVRVHSLRLEGMLAHQEVALTNPGEQLSIVHHSTSYASFAAGAVAAIRAVSDLAPGVHVGLDAVLQLDR